MRGTKDEAGNSGIGYEAAQRLDEVCGHILCIPGKPLSGLALVLVSDGEIAYEGYFGTRQFADSDTENDLPVDINTRWRVASVSKPVVTLGAMKLVERGILDLDRDISEYLGYSLRNPSFPEKPITLRMILGHTSSLRDAGFYYPPFTHSLKDLLVPGGRYYDNGGHFAMPDASKNKAPGAYYEYCNLGYAILGGIIEQCTGKRFDLYMRDEIFLPLGIDGGFNPLLISDERFGDLSPIYRKCPPESEKWDAAGAWQSQIDDYRGIRPKLPVRLPRGEAESYSLEQYRLGENGSLFSPQGGLRICARDLAKIARLLLKGGDGLVSEESVRAMMTSGWIRNANGSNGDEQDSTAFATGIGLMLTAGPKGGPDLWGHHGNAYGFLGGMYLDPARRNGYIFMIGGTGADPEKNRSPKSGLFIWEEKLRGVVEEILSAS